MIILPETCALLLGIRLRRGLNQSQNSIFDNFLLVHIMLPQRLGLLVIGYELGRALFVKMLLLIQSALRDSLD